MSIEGIKQAAGEVTGQLLEQTPAAERLTHPKWHRK